MFIQSTYGTSQQTKSELKLEINDLIDLGVSPDQRRAHNDQKNERILKLKSDVDKMRSIEEDSFEPFACKIETEIDASFEESIAKIISSLEEDNDESNLKTGFVSGCKIIHSSTQSFEKIKEEIFEDIFAEYKTKILKEEKLEKSFNCSQVTIEEDTFHLKSNIELETPKFSKPITLRNLKLWDEIDFKHELNPCTKCSVKLVELPISVHQVFEEIPFKSLSKLGLKRKLEMKTSITDIKQEKRIKTEVQSKVIPTSKSRMKSKPTRNNGKIRKSKSASKQTNKTSTKDLPVSKPKPSRKLKVEKRDEETKISLKGPKSIKAEEAPRKTQAKIKNNGIESSRKASTSRRQKRSTKTTRVKKTETLRGEVKQEIDDFSLECKNSSKISYENFIPQLTVKESKLKEDGVEKFLRKRYIIISSMPLVPRKSILSLREGPKKSSKQVSFCRSIFIRRFVAAAHEDLELS